jgi:hydrogenase expression/formation protein HypE
MVWLMVDLKVGKVPNDVLKRLVYGHLGAADPSILLGPNVGEDAALIKHGGSVLAFKSDPITGSVDEVGALAVYVNANDIATRGANPKWFLQCILLPEDSSEAGLKRIMSQIDETAKELGISVVGGHTEVTRGISRPIVVGSMIGTVSGSSYFTSAGARPGDLLFMTKGAGIEGTVILSSEDKVRKKLGKSFERSAKALRRLINVVPECLALSAIDGISAMHDLTEGGVMGGVWELAEAASLGVEFDLSKVPVMGATRQLCKVLGLDPYRLISSGSIIFTVHPDKADAAEAALKGISTPCSRIGRMTPPGGRRKYCDLRGHWLPLSPPSPDELWKGVHH